MLDRIRIVLVSPSHPGNIGAAARAMKNMGLADLALVSPASFPSHEATVRASGADAVLSNARVVETLPEALSGCDLVFAMSARSRSLAIPVRTPRECAESIKGLPSRQVAFVFGRESSGLTNDELAMAHEHVQIPTDAEFASLNLAQAVQVMAYECRLAALGSDVSVATAPAADEEVELASADQMEGFYEHLQAAFYAVKFLDPNHPKLLMRRMKRLFNRTSMQTVELNILRGFLSAVERRTQSHDNEK